MDKKNRAEDYETISFNSHDDFTFEPENLKDAKKVTITCKNNNQNPLQLLIRADNELTVGALNIFYPKPKTIDLEWCFIEIQGRQKDKNDLARKINYSKIKDYLKKGLNPALIDVTITNNEAALVDISTDTEKLTERGYLKKHSTIGNYIERSKKSVILSFVSSNHNEDVNKLTVYFINQKCINTSDIKEDGTFKMAGGVSPTGTGIAYLVLDDDGNIKSENIIHEVMHALGLNHTFSSTHKFKDTKTDNYMDYENTKKYTYKWQWEKLQGYSKLK
ncbi:hypothetical protein [Lacinutrix mariniflava]|uniref:hypothetical protein n=1 Tax=Lacinutrix mariniflava TaxID=342955 RepID=UPI0006E2D0D4|nr:hypothetical protein [Lacinutrix mariniflava]